MTNINIANAVSILDVHAADEVNSPHAVRVLAQLLAEQFSRHSVWRSTSKFSKADARAAMIALGASTFTVEQFANKVAIEVRRLGRFGL